MKKSIRRRRRFSAAETARSCCETEPTSAKPVVRGGQPASSAELEAAGSRTLALVMSTAASASQPGSTGRKWGRNPWFLLSIAWIFPVLLAAAQEVARGQLGEGQPIGWLVAIGRQLPFWAPLIGLTPLLLAFVRRFPFDRRHWLRGVLTHGFVILLAGLLFLVLRAFLALPIEGREISTASILNTVAA